MNRRTFIAGFAAAAIATAVVTRLAPVLRWQYWRASYHAYWHEHSKMWATFTAIAWDEDSALANARSSDMVNRPWDKLKPVHETLTVRPDGYL